MHQHNTGGYFETAQWLRCIRMVGRYGLVLTLMLGAGRTMAQMNQDKSTEETVVRVLATTAWVETGVTVTSNDRLTISGAGEVCFNEHDDSCFPPQGYPRQAYVKDYFELDYAYCEDEFEAFDHAALIAQIGETILQAGRRITVSGVSGAVRLGVNDCSLKGKFGNSGWYTVIITVEHNPG